MGLEVIGKVMGASWKEHSVRRHHEIPFQSGPKVMVRGVVLLAHSDAVELTADVLGPCNIVHWLGVFSPLELDVKPSLLRVLGSSSVLLDSSVN